MSKKRKVSKNNKYRPDYRERLEKDSIYFQLEDILKDKKTTPANRMRAAQMLLDSFREDYQQQEESEAQSLIRKLLA